MELMENSTDVALAGICLTMQETRDMGDRPLARKDPLEKGMATHSSSLAWRVSWTEEPGGLQSMWSQRVGRD